MTKSRLAPVVNNIIKVLNRSELDSDEILAVIALLGPIACEAMGIEMEEAYDRANKVIQEENQGRVANA